MISYFFKVFQFFAAVCFNRHLLTFWILACLHTARHAPHRNLMHFIFFVPTACVSGAAQKMYTFASENFVCVCICKLEFACPPTEFICNEEYSSNRFLTPIPTKYVLKFYKLKIYILYIHGKYSWDSPEHLGCCIFLKTNLECGFRTDLNMLI